MNRTRTTRKAAEAIDAEAVAVSDARTRLTELVNRVAYGKERFVIVKRGKQIAAIVSAADLALLDGAA